MVVRELLMIARVPVTDGKKTVERADLEMAKLVSALDGYT